MGGMDSGSAALFMDMGTGKSATTIAVAGRLYLDGRIKRMLIVAPSSVCTSWPGEFATFAGYDYRVQVLLGAKAKRIAALGYLQAPTLLGRISPLRVAVINYESTWRLEEELKAFAADLIVCDESQRIKAPSASQSKAMHHLGDGARYKMILSGTPVTQDVRDLWSQYRFLAPGVFNGSFYAFQKRYCVFGGYGNYQYLGARHEEELKRKAHGIAYRIKKEDCLDLPEKTYQTHTVQLEDKAAALYDQLKKTAVAELDGAQVTASLVITKLLRLQQLVGGFLTDDDGKVSQVSTAKLDTLADIVQSCCIDEGRKLVVFARFRAEIDAIQARLDELFGKHGLKYVAIWGDIPLAQRGELVRQFQTDDATRVFVGQVRACSEGLTLTAADTLVYYSTSFSLSEWQQSQDRIHRIGQRNACLYIRLTVPGTIDQKVAAALDKKQNLAKSIVDDWRALLE